MKDNANIMHYFVNKPVCADTFIFMRSLGYARDDRERSARDDREMVLVIGNKKNDNLKYTIKHKQIFIIFAMNLVE